VKNTKLGCYRRRCGVEYIDLKGRTKKRRSEEIARKTLMKILVGKSQRRGIVGESFLATAFLLTLILKKLEGIM